MRMKLHWYSKDDGTIVEAEGIIGVGCFMMSIIVVIFLSIVGATALVATIAAL